MLSIGFVGVLACASWITTYHEWYGMFPSGTWEFRIVSRKGEPIEAADVTILTQGRPAASTLFSNYAGPGSLKSDPNGKICLIKENGGPGFGGNGWLLFWLIPIESSSVRPVFDVQFSRQGHLPASISSDELFHARSLTVVLPGSSEDPNLASSPWVNSKDGALSLRLLVSAKPVRAGDPIVVLAELRNNTGGCVNVLRPFGDSPVARKALRIAGPAGAIVPAFAALDYVLGTGAFVALLPGETIRDRLDVDPKFFPQSALPGKYVLRYPYRATEGNQEQAAQKWINLPNLWVGEIESGKVSLVKEK